MTSKSGVQRALCLVGLVACATPAAPAPSPPPLRPTSSAASVPASAPPPQRLGPAGTAFAAAELPPWLDPDFKDASAPFRARLARSPKLYGDERNEALNDPVAGESRRVELVYEEPPSRDSARVRLLCQSTRERVALYVDRDALALRTRKGAMIAARKEEVDDALASPGSFAGFQCNAGVDLGVTRAVAGNVVKVTYQGDKIRAEGFVARAQLDEVWEWPVDVPSFTANAKIPRDATVLDAPRGKAFARIEALVDDDYDAIAGPPMPDGMAFVRIRTRDGNLGGWVAESKLRRGFNGGRGRLGSNHSTRGSMTNPIELPKGALFFAGNEPIGVVKSDAKFTCVRGCSDPRPVVSVWACGEQVQLVARYPTDRG